MIHSQLLVIIQADVFCIWNCTMCYTSAETDGYMNVIDLLAERNERLE